MAVGELQAFLKLVGPDWAAVALSLLAFIGSVIGIIVAVLNNGSSKRSATAAEDSAKSSDRSAQAAERSAVAAEQDTQIQAQMLEESKKQTEIARKALEASSTSAVPQRPTKPDFVIEKGKGQTFNLRNRGASAKNVVVHTDHPEGLTRSLPKGQDIPRNAGVVFLMAGSMQARLPLSVGVTWDGQDEPVQVELPS